MKKIYCYGDSNTLGYDPRNFDGGTYEEECRWCSLLSRDLSCPVICDGENGRTIPDAPLVRSLLEQRIRQAGATHLLIALGTNDILRQAPGVRCSAAAMEEAVNRIRSTFPSLKILLLSPPPLALPEFRESLAAMASVLALAARNTGAEFLDISQWALPLAFDGVHFSQAGHLQFARRLAQQLRIIYDFPK